MRITQIIFLLIGFTFSPLFLLAQEEPQIREFEYFKNVPQLRDALKTLDMMTFFADNVLWISDTAEEIISAPIANKRLKASIKFPKKFTVRQASETNHGYAQTFGIYNTEEVAVYFVAFRIIMETQKIEEIRVTVN